MVFVASCKQARYLEEVLRRLQAAPAWIGAIHGRLQQTKRMAKYYEFRKLKHGILICTDVAARGLDFPAVDWVVQMDAPESVEAYIHRVGRTARLGGEGSALLMTLPSESDFLGRLAQRGIAVDLVEPKQRKTDDPTPQLQSLLSVNSELKHLAQKAFGCYLRSLSLAACDVSVLPYKAYAQSLGLITVPKIKFGKSRRDDKNAPFALREKGEKEKEENSGGEEEDDDDELLVLQPEQPEMNAKKRRKMRRMQEKKESAEKKRRTQEETALAALGN
jgi:ATP-dependent RNA helicase DDX10/DBP4